MSDVLICNLGPAERSKRWLGHQHMMGIICPLVGIESRYLQKYDWDESQLFLYVPPDLLYAPKLHACMHYLICTRAHIHARTYFDSLNPLKIASCTNQPNKCFGAVTGKLILFRQFLRKLKGVLTKSITFVLNLEI